MRVSIAVCRVPCKPMNFVPDGVHRMFTLTQRGPREDMGYTIDFRCRNEQPGLCSPAKGDPHEGHLRPEMVSLVPPGLRKAIQFETRSVSFLIV